MSRSMTCCSRIASIEFCANSRITTPVSLYSVWPVSRSKIFASSILKEKRFFKKPSVSMPESSMKRQGKECLAPVL